MIWMRHCLRYRIIGVTFAFGYVGQSGAVVLPASIYSVKRFSGESSLAAVMS